MQRKEKKNKTKKEMRLIASVMAVGQDWQPDGRAFHIKPQQPVTHQKKYRFLPSMCQQHLFQIGRGTRPLESDGLLVFTLQNHAPIGKVAPVGCPPDGGVHRAHFHALGITFGIGSVLCRHVPNTRHDECCKDCCSESVRPGWVLGTTQIGDSQKGYPCCAEGQPTEYVG